MEPTIPVNWTYPQFPTTERGRALHLTVSPCGTKFAYPCMNNVIIRDQNNLNSAVTVVPHSGVNVTSVAFGPKGDKIALGSEKGQVIVWNHAREDQMIAFDCNPIQTRVNDIAWTDCGDKIAVVGEGNGVIGKTIDTKLKKIDQDLDRHTSHALSVTFKGDRPFKVFTASEDTNVNFFKGPPFNLEKTIDSAHSKFVNVVRTHPSNQFVVSSGSDLNLVVFDANTGEITQKKEKIHDGSIYSIQFFDGGNKMVTCSADKTVKVWKWDGLELLHTLIVSEKPTVEDMQVGVAVTKEYIISLSLKGVFNYWKIADLEGETVKPTQTQAGHRKNVIQSWYNTGRLMTIDTDGRVLHFACLNNFPEYVDLNKGVNNAVFLSDGSSACVSSGDKVSVYKTPTFDEVFEVKADGFVNAVEFITPTKVVAVTNKNTITAFEDGAAVATLNLGEEGLCINLSQDKSALYVGGTKGTFFKINPETLTLEKKEALGQKITCVQASHSNALVAVGAGNGIVAFYSNTENKFVSTALKYHGNFITSLVFTPDDSKVFSSAYESVVFVWDATTLKKADKIANIGHRGAINHLFLEGNSFVSVGVDAAIKKWSYAIN